MRCNLVLSKISSTEQRRQQFIRHSDFKYRRIQAFTANECQEIQSKLSSDYVLRHSAYKTNSQSFKDKHVIKLLENKLFTMVTGFEPCDLFFIDLFVVKYDLNFPLLESHTDGCLLSFTLQLNNENEFQGGGLEFTKTGERFDLTQGEMILFRSKIEHRGIQITQGERIILVGFIETKRMGILSKEYFINKERAANGND